MDEDQRLNFNSFVDAYDAYQNPNLAAIAPAFGGYGYQAPQLNMVQAPNQFPQMSINPDAIYDPTVAAAMQILNRPMMMAQTPGLLGAGTDYQTQFGLLPNIAAQRLQQYKRIFAPPPPTGLIESVLGGDSGGGDDSGNMGDASAGMGGASEGSAGSTAATASSPDGPDGANASSGSSSGDKIVCTAMNQAYGFGSFRNRIWLAYSAKNLTKAHEAGYHALFLPLVSAGYRDVKWYSPPLRAALENIARHRSADLRAEMRGGKRDRVGQAYRFILEPLCYAVGKLKGK